MSVRSEIVALMDEVILDGDELRDRTNAAIDGGLEVTLAQSETIMLGARGLNGLRSIRVLTENFVDDQIAILARALYEAAIDVEYLNEPTVRRTRGGKKEIPLDSDAKSLLFATHKPLALHGIITEFYELEPDDPIPDEVRAENPDIDWDGMVEECRKATDLRKQLGLQSSPYWACTGNGGMIGELRRSLPKAAGKYRNFRRLFQDFSFFAHANPNDSPYVVRPVGMKIPEPDAEGRMPGGKLCPLFRDDSILGASILAALEIFRWWGHALGEELRPQFLEYIRRLNGMKETA